MALSKQITDIDFQPVTGSGNSWAYNFKINNMTFTLGQVNYKSPTDEAIDGTLRSNLRGVRIELVLNYDSLASATVSGSGSTPEAFVNDMIDAIATDGDRSIEVSLDSGVTYYEVVPDETTLETIYTNQIGNASANLVFKGRSIITSITSDLQAP